MNVAIAFALKYWKAILAGVLVLALVATTSLWRHEVKAFDKFKIDVAATAKAQNDKVQAIEKTQSAVTKQSEGLYLQGSDALTSIYGAGRVQLSTSSSKLPRVSKATSKPNATPANARPSAALPSACSCDCEGLRADAAQTTMMLLFLQDWNEKQSVINQ